MGRSADRRVSDDQRISNFKLQTLDKGNQISGNRSVAASWLPSQARAASCARALTMKQRATGALLVIEVGIIQRPRVIDRLNVGENYSSRQAGAHIILDLFRQVMRTLHRPTARHQDVHRDEAARRR